MINSQQGNINDLARDSVMLLTYHGQDLIAAKKYFSRKVYAA